MWSLKKSRRAVGAIRPYMRPHRSWLVRGAVATVGLVLLRLALPWPLRGMMEVVFPGGSGSGATVVDILPAAGDPILWLIGFYLVVAFGMGLAEMFQRVSMAKFAVHTVHDLRSAAVRGALRSAAPGERGASGDLIARVIGDTARIKTSLKGIMIHISQNGLLYLGVCVVFLFISPKLSAFFLLGGGLAIWISYRTSSRVAALFRKQRSKEGAYASSVQEALDYGEQDFAGDGVNDSSAKKDVRVTKMITFSSLIVHFMLAATVGVAVWVGARDVAAGALAPGELFLFILYVLLVHRRVVQVGRQIARSGKVLACVDRVGALVSVPEAGSVAAENRTLESGIRLEEVRVDSIHNEEKPRLRRMSWTLEAGSRVAVLGLSGSGKSTFLKLVAGVEAPDKGTIFWDGEEIADPGISLRPRVGYLSQEPVFARARVWRILGLEGPDRVDPRDQETLKRIGAWKMMRRFRRGLEEKVSSASLSPGERRALRLGAILLGDAKVWVLDAPLQGLDAKRAARRLEEILLRAQGRALVISMSDYIDTEPFGRVLALRKGIVRFDGPAEQWRETAHEEDLIGRRESSG